LETNDSLIKLRELLFTGPISKEVVQQIDTILKESTDELVLEYFLGHMVSLYPNFEDFFRSLGYLGLMHLFIKEVSVYAKAFIDQWGGETCFQSNYPDWLVEGEPYQNYRYSQTQLTISHLPKHIRILEHGEVNTSDTIHIYLVTSKPYILLRIWNSAFDNVTTYIKREDSYNCKGYSFNHKDSRIACENLKLQIRNIFRTLDETYSELDSHKRTIYLNPEN